jgi:hypothetical protein
VPATKVCPGAKPDVVTSRGADATNVDVDTEDV